MPRFVVTGVCWLTQENFGIDKHFFFVNRSTGTLIDDQMLGFMALRTLQLQPG